MIFRTLLILIAFFIAGCGLKASEPTIVGADAPANANETSAAAAATPPEREPNAAAGDRGAEFEKLEFSAKKLPAAIKYDGRVTGGARWRDALGENTLVVSEKTERGADFSVQKIFGYLYVEKDGETRLVWKIQDSAENPCDAGKGLASPVEVRDIDGDRVAENMFVYNIAGGCDVSPIAYKLMMHSGERKLAVRGANAVEISGYNQKSEKNFDAAFDAAPKDFRRAASEFWDRHVKPLRADVE